MNVNIESNTATVLTEDANGTQYKYLFSRQGDELELQSRQKARHELAGEPGEPAIPDWKTVTPEVTPAVRRELEENGYHIV